MRLLGFFLRWSKYDGSASFITFYSLVFIVLIKNLLSKDENMKDPLLPADSLALNSCLALASVDNDASIISGVIPSIFLIAWNTAGAHSITYTSSLIVIVLISSLQSKFSASLASVSID